MKKGLKLIQNTIRIIRNSLVGKIDLMKKGLKLYCLFAEGRGMHVGKIDLMKKGLKRKGDLSWLAPRIPLERLT